MTTAINRVEACSNPTQSEVNAWNGAVQICDQTESSISSSTKNEGLWNWDVFSDTHLCEINEFRPYLPLHNYYDGQSVSMDGCITMTTMETIEEKMRSILEACDNLRFVQALVDMDSSWGGLACSVLAYLNEECPHAVVAVFGNDCPYPLPDSYEDNGYSPDPTCQDQSKVFARRRINLAASLTSLSEYSSIMIPIAMAPTSRRYHTPQSSSYCYTSFVSASAIELALAPFRTKSVYQLLEGIIPSMKIMELGARIPLVGDPSLLIDEATAHSDSEQLLWNASSFLPGWKAPLHLGSHLSRPRFRRVHLRGPFTESTLLPQALERIQTQNVVVDWSPSPFALPSPTNGAQTKTVVPAAAQLTLSHQVGEYLEHLATDLPSAMNGRVLYEFLQAGMNVDAMNEFQSQLLQYKDEYP